MNLFRRIYHFYTRILNIIQFKPLWNILNASKLFNKHKLYSELIWFRFNNTKRRTKLTHLHIFEFFNCWFRLLNLKLSRKKSLNSRFTFIVQKKWKSKKNICITDWWKKCVSTNCYLCHAGETIFGGIFQIS